MTGTNVQSLIPGFVTVRLSPSENAPQVQTEGSKGSGSFSDVMDKTTKKSVEPKTKAKDKTAESTLKEEIKKSGDIAKKLKEADESNANAVAENGGEEVVSEVLTQLKESIAKELNITVEELNTLLKNMNISDEQLFNPDILGKIVLEVRDLSSPRDLLLDGEAALEFKNLIAMMQEAKEELLTDGIEVTKQGFTDVKTGEVIELKAEEVITEELQTETKDVVKQLPEENAEVRTDNEPEDVQEQPQADMTKENTADANPNTNPDTDTNPNMNTPDTGKKQTSVKEDSTSQSEENSTVQLKFSPIENIEQVLTERVGRMQTDSIISQITEQIKLNVNSEFKSMEMQLYPEHLGKVGVQVVIKDGAITAQISAETEAVKKVLEAQITALKDNFNSQGLKVENVEVTIASRGFEQNNMRNGEGREEPGKGRRGRKTGASFMDEVNAENEAEEQTIMETLGNTVSYSA